MGGMVCFVIIATVLVYYKVKTASPNAEAVGVSTTNVAVAVDVNDSATTTNNGDMELYSAENQKLRELIFDDDGKVVVNLTR